MTESWDGESYQQRIERLAAEGGNPHGEVDLVMTFSPASVLDAGCGTGRAAIELARRGVDVVGVDVDPSMLATARRLGPHIEWIDSPLQDLDLGRTFDVVLLAGNVPLFTPPGTTAALIAGCARHVGDGGVLVAGFALDGRYAITQYDAEAAAAGLALQTRYATWDRHPWAEDADYAVSIHRLSAG